MRRLMGMVTFLLLLPVGAFFDGWGSTFLFLLVFRFIRMQTGGYHAKTPAGCLLGSTFTMIVSLEFAKRLHPVSFERGRTCCSTQRSEIKISNRYAFGVHIAIF